MPLELYQLPVSAPCRAVRLCLSALGLEANIHDVNVMEGEQMKPEFLEINHQHQIPTLVDTNEDFTLSDSHAINTYLVAKYAEDDSLYPSDVKTKAMIDRLLFFDVGTLNSRMEKYLMPIIMGNADTPCPETLAKLQEALGFLDKFIDGRDFAVGDSITVADFSLAATVASLVATGVEITDHPNVENWLAKCKENLPGYDEINEPGAEEMGNFVKAKLAGEE